MPPNNTDSGSVSVSDDLTKESNTSEIVPNHLDKRQVMPLFTYPGLPVWISSSQSRVHSTSKKCTLGFPIRKTTGAGRGQFAHGFLTLGSCMTSDADGRSNGAFHLRPTLDPNQPEEIKIGSAGRLVYSRTGLNYAIVALLSNSPYGL